MNNLVKSPAMAIEKNSLVVKYFQTAKNKEGEKEITFEMKKTFSDVKSLDNLPEALEGFIFSITKALQLSEQIKAKSGLIIDLGIRKNRETYFEVIQGSEKIYTSAKFKPAKAIVAPNAEVELVLSLLMATSMTKDDTTYSNDFDNVLQISNYMKDNADLLEENKQVRIELKEERKRLKELETAK